MKKIITIVGARPQIIKAAAMSRAFQNCADIEEVLVHTGQHYDQNMSDVFFSELNIPKPKYNLNTGSGEREEQIRIMTEGIKELMEKELPDLVLVYGDTNSTLAGANAAYELQVPVAHIEAGLRSFNQEMPEEKNRILTDQKSTLLYCPTSEAERNLENENFSSNASIKDANAAHPFIETIGDIMLDNTLYFSKLANENSRILQEIGVKEDFILATCHRPSNTDNETHINAIFSSLLELAESNNITCILPIHPRTKKMFHQLVDPQLRNQIEQSSKFKIIDPVSFLDIVQLESKSRMIVTDSGGIQKEAFFLRKPCIVLREETEWVELVENGNAILTGPDQEKIRKAFKEFENRELTYPDFYGKGNSSEKIAHTIQEFLVK